MSRIAHIKRQLMASIEQSGGLSRAEKTAVIQGYDDALANERPPRLVLIGETGVGKSTTLNALFNAGQPVGHTKATTDHAYVIPVQQVNGSKGKLEVVDMPGLGDDLANYQRYLDLYLRILPTADTIVWVHVAEDRMVHLIQQALDDIFRQRHPELIGRLVFGLSKADEMNPHNWNRSANLPSRAQLDALQERQNDFTEKITRVLPSWKGRAVSYSAKQRYNLPALFKEMMYAVPEHRRWVLEERMDLADFTTLVDEKLLHATQARTLAEVEPHSAPSTAHAAAAPRHARSGSSVADPFSELSEVEWLKLRNDWPRLQELMRRAEQENGR